MPKPDQNTQRIIGSRVREERERQGMSQSEFAEVLGAKKGDKQLVSNIERGLKAVSADRLIEIAVALGVEPLSLTKENSIRKILGDRIRTEREKRGYSLEELGHKVRTGKQQMSRIETGNQPLWVDMLIDIASALGMPPESLIHNIHPSRHQESPCAVG